MQIEGQREGRHVKRFNIEFAIHEPRKNKKNQSLMKIDGNEEEKK
jgi:hypothetical protein